MEEKKPEEKKPLVLQTDEYRKVIAIFGLPYNPPPDSSPTPNESN